MLSLFELSVGNTKQPNFEWEDRRGVWIVLFSEVTPFADNVSIILSPIVASRPRILGYGISSFCALQVSPDFYLSLVITFLRYSSVKWFIWKLAGENSRHFATPKHVSPRNDVWETIAEILCWLRVTILIGHAAAWEICFNQSEKHYSALGSDPAALWNFCCRFLRSHFAWKPVMSTWNVGCFPGNLKARRLQIVARLKMCVSKVYVLFFVLSEHSFLSCRSVWTFSATSSSVLNLLFLNHY